MTIKQISTSTVRISMSAGELASYHVSFGILDTGNPETTALLSALIERIEEICPLPMKNARLFVEAFRCKDGGCLLYLSLIDEEEEEPPEEPVCILLCDFKSPSLLTACCKRCQNQTALFSKSACYRSGNAWRLVAQTKPQHRHQAKRLLAEFGSVLPATELSLSVTLEHYECLVAQNAMEQISREPLSPPRTDPAS